METPRQRDSVPAEIRMLVRGMLAPMRRHEREIDETLGALPSPVRERIAALGRRYQTMIENEVRHHVMCAASEHGLSRLGDLKQSAMERCYARQVEDTRRMQPILAGEIRDLTHENR